MNNTNLSLFPEEYPEVEADPMAPAQEEPETFVLTSAIGQDFVINRCTCNQLIMVDPTFAPFNLPQDCLCEACNPKFKEKYLKYLKLKL